MPKCKRVRGRKRIVCSGDLTQEITVQTRAIVPPSGSSVDFQEAFSPEITVFSMVLTVHGETLFDGSNVEQIVTHKFYIRFIPNITFQNWVLYNGVRYRLLDTENLDQRNEFFLLRATVRGSDTLNPNKL